MIKDTVIKLIKYQLPTDVELNSLLVDYIKRKKGKEPTVQELDQIRGLVHNRIFGLEPVIEEYKKLFNLQVITLTDLKTNNIIRIDVYG